MPGAVVGLVVVVAGALLALFRRGVQAPTRLNNTYRKDLAAALASVDAQFLSLITGWVVEIHATTASRRGFFTLGRAPVTALDLQAATAAAVTNARIHGVEALLAERYEMSHAIPALVWRSRVQGWASLVALPFVAALAIGEVWPSLVLPGAVTITLGSCLGAALATSVFAWILIVRFENHLSTLITAHRGSGTF